MAPKFIVRRSNELCVHPASECLYGGAGGKWAETSDRSDLACGSLDYSWVHLFDSYSANSDTRDDSRPRRLSDKPIHLVEAKVA
jgi:hypothetical protein